MLSGVAGLIYEIGWIRRATLVFGSTSVAVSTVLAVYFLGLAAGSEFFGRRSARTTRPLRLVAHLEFGLALLGPTTMAAFGLAELVYGALYRAHPDGAVVHTGLRVALVALLLFPPTFLMGGTLPLFCRQFASQETKLLGSVGGLYALNTLGGAIGCALAGFTLLPLLGLWGSILVAASINAVAGVALRMLRGPAHVLETRPEPAADRDAGRTRAVVVTLFFVTGFVALGQQVLWTRYLGLLVRNSVYTYTLTVGTILVGIVCGSALVARLVRNPRRMVGAFGALHVGLGLIVLCVMLLPPSAWGALAGDLRVYFVLLLAPAVLSGASFPLAVRLVVTDVAHVGRGVGRMAAVNTAGGIAGSLLVGLVALPALGLHDSIILTTGLAVAAGVVAWSALGRGPERLRRIPASGVAVAAWLAVPQVLATRLPHDFLAPADDLVAVREGLQSNLAVVERDGDLQLEIDRWWQGQARKNHQIFAAHLPMLLHADPQRVLVVGAGAGQTPARFLMYDVERVDCVDIEPAVFELIDTYFASDWMRDPRVRLVATDGRSYVAHASDSYDVISLELGQVFRPGVASFYTADFYRLVRSRLEPDGIVSQFVPITLLGPDDFRSIVGTFLEVFPVSTLWYNTSELVLVGRVAERFEIATERLQLLRSDARIHSDLRYSHWGGEAQWLNQPHVVLGCFLTGPEGLSRLAGDAPIYRDDRPVLDYAAVRVDPSQDNERPIVEMLRNHLEPVEEFVSAPVALDSIEAVRRANLQDIVASALIRRALALRHGGDYERVVELLDDALRANPHNVVAQRLLGDAFVLQGLPGVAQPYYESALSARPDDAPSHRGLGFILQRQGNLDAALEHYRAALEAEPRSAETHNNLGTILAQRGDFRGARRHFEAALDIRPSHVDAARNLIRLREAQSAKAQP